MHCGQAGHAEVLALMCSFSDLHSPHPSLSLQFPALTQGLASAALTSGVATVVPKKRFGFVSFKYLFFFCQNKNFS